jgi:4'-phosphopantetheinyl transferase
LTLETDLAHVFQLELDLTDEQQAILADYLSPDERARAARFLPTASRKHFINARGQMREIFAAYLGKKPQEIEFSYNPYGKPYLKEPEQHHSMRFNLSHSVGMGLLALTAGQEVGVDIERTNREVDYANISSRFFSPTEAIVIRELPLQEQAQAFFNGWTRKEAYIKARGLGLTVPLDSFEVSLLPGDSPRIITSDGNWTVYPLDPGPGFIAALVTEAPVSGIRCWKWPVLPPQR